MQRALQQQLRSATARMHLSTTPVVANIHLPASRLFGSSQCQREGRSRLTMPIVNARGKALQELLDERDEEKEDTTPIATTLEWETPLKVLQYPDPRLRAPNAAIGTFDDALRMLAAHMFEVMYEDDGCGLAAPQVGVNVRLMVWNESGKKGQGQEVVLVNPKIISSSKDGKVFEEGCLSFPGLYGDVIRPSKVRVKAQDLSGKQFTFNLSGFAARVFQHEYDHLQGVLYCDRMSADVLASLRSELVAMEEKYIKENPSVEVQRLPAA